MTQRHYAMALSGLAARDGQISFTDLAQLAEAMQNVARRLARQVGGNEGPGRSPRVIDAQSNLVLTGLTAGSTVLDFDLGEIGTLEFPGGSDDEIADRFEEIVAAIATNSRPPWVSPVVSDAVEGLTRTLKSTGARSLRLTRDHDTVAEIAPEQVDSTIWVMPRERDQRQIVVSGTLFAVDTHARRFRLTDDLGNDITLVDVQDPDSVARLVTGRVSASGTAEFDENGRLRNLLSPSLQPFDLPESWLRPEPHDPVALVGGSISDGIPGLTDDEVDEFLAAL